MIAEDLRQLEFLQKVFSKFKMSSYLNILINFDRNYTVEWDTSALPPRQILIRSAEKFLTYRRLNSSKSEHMHTHPRDTRNALIYQRIAFFHHQWISIAIISTFVI